jgi:hypothetical protein
LQITGSNIVGLRSRGKASSFRESLGALTLALLPRVARASSTRKRDSERFPLSQHHNRRGGRLNSDSQPAPTSRRRRFHAGSQVRISTPERAITC